MRAVVNLPMLALLQLGLNERNLRGSRASVCWCPAAEINPTKWQTHMGGSHFDSANSAQLDESAAIQRSSKIRDCGAPVHKFNGAG